MPGFPIPRTVVTASGAGGQALLAAGVVPHQDNGIDLQALVREQIVRFNAEHARAIARAQVMAQVRKIRTERARAQLGC